MLILQITYTVPPHQTRMLFKYYTEVVYDSLKCIHMRIKTQSFAEWRNKKSISDTLWVKKGQFHNTICSIHANLQKYSYFLKDWWPSLLPYQGFGGPSSFFINFHQNCLCPTLVLVDLTTSYHFTPYTQRK